MPATRAEIEIEIGTIIGTGTGTETAVTTETVGVMGRTDKLGGLAHHLAQDLEYVTCVNLFYIPDLCRSGDRAMTCASSSAAWKTQSSTRNDSTIIASSLNSKATTKTTTDKTC